MQIQQFLKQNANFILVGIIVLAFGLRYHKIGEHGLAGDEKYSLFVSQFVTYEGNNQHDSVRKPSDKYFTPKEFWSKKSLPDFFDSIARLDTGNGALYTYSLHYWTKAFGVSDKSMRMPSLIFNLFTIVLLFFFVKEYFRSPNLALLAAFLASVSPFYINYSQVARNYSINLFFALLATHLLLKIIQEEENNQKPVWKYVFYGACALACELCHFATFPLFMIHALFVILFFRKKRGYFGFTLAAIIPLIGVLWWLNCDGGRWLFDYMANSVKTYNQMALATPDDYLNVANLKNILKQLRHVISAMFLLIDGYPSQTIFYKKLYLLIILSALFGFFVFVQQSLKISDRQQFRLRVLIFLLSLIPLLTLIVFAYQDGNTFRIIPRYLAYSYSFSLVLISLIIKDLWNIKPIFKFAIFGIFTLQFFMVFRLINTIWEDNSPRYFMSFSEPRKMNPYEFSASVIQREYAKGDTVLYPSVFIEKRGGVGMPSYSVSDAQLTNFYLPKDAEFIQRVDIQEENKIIIKKVNGSEKLIFDFKGAKYRY